jgi:hypothetical protein
MEVLGHHRTSDQREAVVRAPFIENFQEDIARASRAQEGASPVATARDEVEVTLTVAAFEACRHEPKTSTPHPFQLRRDGAPT